MTANIKTAKKQISEGKKYHHGDLHRALIEAGSAILAEQGLAGLDLRKTAQRAGVSHAAPYRHFADKKALLAGIAESGYVSLLAAVQANVQNGSTPPEKMIAMSQAYLDFALSNEAHFRVMFSGLNTESEKYPSLYASSKQAFNALLLVVEEGQQASIFTSEREPIDLAVQFWANLHGLTLLLLEGQLTEIYPTREEQYHLLVQSITTLCRGLKSI